MDVSQSLFSICGMKDFGKQSPEDVFSLSHKLELPSEREQAAAAAPAVQ